MGEFTEDEEDRVVIITHTGIVTKGGIGFALPGNTVSVSNDEIMFVFDKASAETILKIIEAFSVHNLPSIDMVDFPISLVYRIGNQWPEFKEKYSRLFD